MFVIPCKYNPKAPFIINCVDSIRKYMPDEPITVVDSCSSDQSYASFLQKNYTNIHILYNNSNYATGALWKAYESFPNEDYYTLIHDSTEITTAIKLKSDIQCILVSGEDWKWPEDKKNQKSKRTNEKAKKMLLNSKIKFNEKLKHRTIIGPMFKVKHKILHKLFELDFNKVLPTNKYEMQQMERLWGYVFQYIGYDNNDLYSNSFLKGTEDDYGVSGRKKSPISEYELKTFNTDKPISICCKTFTPLTSTYSVTNPLPFGPRVLKTKALKSNYPIIKYWYDRK